MRVLMYNNKRIAIAKILVGNITRIFEILPNNVQILNVKCWEQVVFATVLALKSFERGTNKAKTMKNPYTLSSFLSVSR